MRSVTGAKGLPEGGFALLQVIMALAIISVILVPMVNSYVSSWRQSLAAEKRSRAKMLVRWKLEKQMAVDFGSLESVDAEDCQLPGEIPDVEDFQCSVTVEELNGSSSNFDVRRIDVTILYQSLQSDGERSVFCPELEDSSCPDLTTYRTNRST